MDTYDVVDGVQAAIRTIKRLGVPPTCAVRLDSGDLDSLSRRTRAALDSAGLPEARIVISGGLDEYAIDALVREGVPDLAALWQLPVVFCCENNLLVAVGNASPELIKSTDLLVVGGPTHIRGMATGFSRKMGISGEDA